MINGIDKTHCDKPMSKTLIENTVMYQCPCGHSEIARDLAIESITAYLSIDSHGSEGILCAEIRPAVIMPLIGADEERIKSLKSIAEDIKHLTGVDYRIVKFTNREQVV